MTTTVYRPSTSSTGNVDITGDISASGTINTVGITSNANATAITIDDSENVGIGIATPDGRLHVQTATAGNVEASSGGDDLVVENSATGGISILMPDASNCNFMFGSPADNLGALIQWNYSGKEFSIGTHTASGFVSFSVAQDAEAMRITALGNVIVGATTGSASAILHVSSTTQGFLPPRMTTTQRDAITSPAAGLTIYNTTTAKLNVYTTAWEAITSA